MKNLVYPRERSLRTVALLIAIIFWLALIIGTAGVGLFYILSFFVFYVFAQSALIAHLRGQAVRMTSAQMPDLFARVERCCKTLEIETVPEVYLLHGNGAFNAFATRFLGRDFLILLSDVVDALHDRQDAVDFYIGHELGHIRQKHLLWAPVLAPALFLPLLGAAYSRAREYTCDRHGLACCPNSDDALRGMAAMAAGRERWRTLELGEYAAQAELSRGFWMSFHELVADYPWLTKRLHTLLLLAKGREPELPGRHGLAWVLALFVPRIPGAGGGFIVVVAIVGILAAIAIPAYQDFTQRARIAAAITAAAPYKAAIGGYIVEHGKRPQSAEDIGMQGVQTKDKSTASIEVGDAGSIRIHLTGLPLSGGTVVLEPIIKGNELNWQCQGEGVKPKWLPANCR